ncbi:MAG: hypothetical protein C4533_02850 [Candidatus Omnitrophota bacterium]|jgi:uncharacterized membrane protein|nr:MAG: hypothetical protein C4533_02850 [Candidatus Omnitrophota bacterium]
MTEDREIREGKIYAMVGYWLFLCILPLLLKKDNKFAVHHGKQGLVLFIFIVAAFIFYVIPILGPLLYRLASVVYFICFLWGSIEALRGRYCRIPIIADIADKIIL